VSKIKSLEKKPEKKGKPQRDKIQTTKAEANSFLPGEKGDMLRKSWLLSSLWITTPPLIKSEALNNAWVKRWKKAK